MLSEHFCESPCVNTADAGNLVFLQVAVQICIAPEIGGMGAPFPHNIGRKPCSPALLILPDDSIISNQGKGLDNRLPFIALICQRFNVACHGRGKHDLCRYLSVSSESRTFQYFSVFQDKVSVHSSVLLSKRLCSG